MTPDEAYILLGSLDLFWLLLAFAGGAFATMIGPNRAFAFTGISILVGLGVLAGTKSPIFLDYVAFGPVFGPHISFAGGAAASAYAARRGLLTTGRDIDTAMAGLNRPDVIFVGAIFGAGGYVLQKLITLIPWFGSHTDSVALTVFTSAIVARVLFGKTPVFFAPLKPTDTVCWLRWQETPAQIFTVSLFSALMAGGATLMVSRYVPTIAGSGHTLVFAVSAVCIFFVSAGLKLPVTHHQTVTAGVAAWTFFGLGFHPMGALLAAALFGVLAGFLAELMARLFLNQGDTHIDPPAGAIWIMNTAIMLCALPFAAA
jgi:hypothetical protein